jgi:hypothetical protein
MKYEMIPEGGMFRVKALKDFGAVRKGDLGGLIEKEENLSQNGSAWVSGNAEVHGDAQVHGEAQVYGSAQVYGYAQASLSPICITGLLWGIIITDRHIQIGCELHLKTEWDSFDDNRISRMDENALGFWKKYKPMIMLAAR